MKKKLNITLPEELIQDLKIYVLKFGNNNVSQLIEQLATDFLKEENKMKNVQTLWYHDTTTGIYHKLYELTGDHMEIDALIDFAGLSVEKIEEQLGFEIDYENLTTERE